VAVEVTEEEEDEASAADGELESQVLEFVSNTVHVLVWPSEAWFRRWGKISKVDYCMLYNSRSVSRDLSPCCMSSVCESN
jgi:hypothetical protein